MNENLKSENHEMETSEKFYTQHIPCNQQFIKFVTAQYFHLGFKMTIAVSVITNNFKKFLRTELDQWIFCHHVYFSSDVEMKYWVDPVGNMPIRKCTLQSNRGQISKMIFLKGVGSKSGSLPRQNFSRQPDPGH